MSEQGGAARRRRVPCAGGRVKRAGVSMPRCAGIALCASGARARPTGKSACTCVESAHAFALGRRRRRAGLRSWVTSNCGGQPAPAVLGASPTRAADRRHRIARRAAYAGPARPSTSGAVRIRRRWFFDPDLPRIVRGRRPVAQSRRPSRGERTASGPVHLNLPFRPLVPAARPRRVGRAGGAPWARVERTRGCRTAGWCATSPTPCVPRRALVLSWGADVDADTVRRARVPPDVVLADPLSGVRAGAAISTYGALLRMRTSPWHRPTSSCGSARR
jgi:hypothetical protein